MYEYRQALMCMRQGDSPSARSQARNSWGSKAARFRELV